MPGIDKPHPFPPGGLWQGIVRRTQAALAQGALVPIVTEQTRVEDGGVNFIVRSVSALKRKEADKRKRMEAGREPANPFLPYEEALYVADVSDHHVCLLNKFNVIDHHLLIVTRRFEHQEALLSAEDFHALWRCLSEFPGLGFYNGGVVAGASQVHKHLQVVPLPLAENGPAVPMAVLFDRIDWEGETGRVAGLPFVHAFSRLEAVDGDASRAAPRLHEVYRGLLRATGLREMPVDGETRQSGPYNLLLTREWMLLVPRSREHSGSISINALGFAGALLVRNAEEMQSIRRHGPMNILRQVSFERRVPSSE